LAIALTAHTAARAVAFQSEPEGEPHRIGVQGVDFQLLLDLGPAFFDLTKDQQTNQAYYLIRIMLPEPEVRRLGELKLVPGMPAEVFAQTGERTPLQYLLKPLREQIARTFRER
jgi:multidrug efflux pump subunit AcrA (membrane-fusion protein)